MGVERVSAPMQVVNAIRDAIRRGELKEGDRLPSETELARQLGVGRSSFREGMRILNAYGVVEIRQGEGTYITNKCAEQIFEFMGFFPDNANVKPLIELRRVLEIGSLKLAAHRIDARGLERLGALVDELEQENSTERNIYLDKSFHVLLVQLTDNPLLVQCYSMMNKMLSNLMNQLMCHNDVLNDARRAHRRIYEALRAGDVEGTIREMEKHLDEVATYARRNIERQSE